MNAIDIFWLLAGVCLFLMFLLIFGGRDHQADDRIKELADADSSRPDRFASEAPLYNTKLRKYVRKEEKSRELRNRMIQAGFYDPESAYWLTTVKTVSSLLPVAIGAVVSLFTEIPFMTTMFLGLTIGLIGTLTPTFILDIRKRSRQKKIRRALPDALDVLGVCLEGGMSFQSSLLRVSQELSLAHPDLALELAIVDRETRMGLSPGEALRKFADRFDLEEIRSMAGVVLQAQQYGSSLVDAMTVFAESMREKRAQYAETRAQQAVVKIIFPTMLCIFPALFLVVVGPAAIQIYQTLVVDGPQ